MKDTTNRDVSLQETQRRRNLYLVMAFCMRHEGSSKREICAGTKLSWGLVSHVVNDLVSRRFLDEVGHDRLPGAGRNSFGYSPSEKRYVSFGLSIERDHFVLKALSLKKNILFEIDKNADTSSKDKVFAGIFSIIDEGIEKLKEDDKELMSIGLSVQSYVDSEDGVIIRFPGLDVREWERCDVLTPLCERYGVKNFVERDGVCLLFEDFVKNGRGNRVLLLLDNSISFGIMADGQIVSGKNKLDLGHCVFDLNGPDKNRTISSLISIKGICASLGISKEELFSSPEKYADELHKVGRYIGLVLHNIYRLYSLQNIVLAGQLMKLKDYFIGDVYETITQFLGEDAKKEVLISVSDSENGAIGAALLGMHEGIKDKVAER